MFRIAQSSQLYELECVSSDTQIEVCGIQLADERSIGNLWRFGRISFVDTVFFVTEEQLFGALGRTLDLLKFANCTFQRPGQALMVGTLEPETKEGATRHATLPQECSFSTNDTTLVYRLECVNSNVAVPGTALVHELVDNGTAHVLNQRATLELVKRLLGAGLERQDDYIQIGSSLSASKYIQTDALDAFSQQLDGILMAKAAEGPRDCDAPPQGAPPGCDYDLEMMRLQWGLMEQQRPPGQPERSGSQQTGIRALIGSPAPGGGAAPEPPGPAPHSPPRIKPITAQMRAVDREMREQVGQLRACDAGAFQRPDSASSQRAPAPPPGSPRVDGSGAPEAKELLRHIRVQNKIIKGLLEEKQRIEDAQTTELSCSDPYERIARRYRGQQAGAPQAKPRKACPRPGSIASHESALRRKKEFLLGLQSFIGGL